MNSSNSAPTTRMLTGAAASWSCGPALGATRRRCSCATSMRCIAATAASGVAVLPEPEDVEVSLSADEYRKDLFCASGPGGQHVNKTASAVRLTHMETGIVVQCQDEKSQHKNLAKALRVLKTRIYEYRRQIEHDKRSAERKTLVGSGDRSQRIRTYNFPQNRLTDHRINESFTLDQVMAGRLGLVIDAIELYARELRRSEMERTSKAAPA